MKARNPMKSHYCMTIFQYEEASIQEKMNKDRMVDFTPIIEKIIEVGRMMRAHYVCWSLEDSNLEPEFMDQTASPSVGLESSINPVTMKNLDSAISETRSFTATADADKTSAVRQDSEITSGGIHIHVYMELNRTIRWSTVVNKFQKNGFTGTHVEVRKGWRETCREYHMGTKNFEEKPTHITHGEWGKWREELGTSYSKEDYYELAAGMILHGYTPSQVARRFPTWFIRHGNGVYFLWKTLRDNEF